MLHFQVNDRVRYVGESGRGLVPGQEYVVDEVDYANHRLSLRTIWRWCDWGSFALVVDEYQPARPAQQAVFHPNIPSQLVPAIGQPVEVLLCGQAAATIRVDGEKFVVKSCELEFVDVEEAPVQKAPEVEEPKKLTPRDWFKEYYPIPAHQAAAQGEEAALLHSQRKWQGLDRETLENYGMRVQDKRHLAEPGFGVPLLAIDASTCALCSLYLSKDCAGCPLLKLRGVPCDKPAGGTPGPYSRFTLGGDPKPMQRLLAQAVAERNRLQITIGVRAGVLMQLPLPIDPAVFDQECRRLQATSAERLDLVGRLAEKPWKYC